MTRPLRVLYLGNFDPPHSTEQHVLRALRTRGHVATPMQENHPATWRRLGQRPPAADVVLWTRTAWNWRRHGLDPRRAAQAQTAMLRLCLRAGIPTVGYHLDRWWGLAREREVASEPFFRVALLVTADGGHDDEWARAGVEHAWLPPAVSEPEARPGTWRAEYASDVAFVGSWQGAYHAEWPHRAELVAWLRDTYGDRVRFWPARGQPAVRGDDLRDLYASVKVVVGDSCLIGGRGRYCSDRLPETIGRGGYLVHPLIEGVTDGTLYEPGRHLAVWALGNWAALRRQIDAALADDECRTRVAVAGRTHVLEHHTYEKRMEQLVALLSEREMISP